MEKRDKYMHRWIDDRCLSILSALNGSGIMLGIEQLLLDGQTGRQYIERQSQTDIQNIDAQIYNS